MRKSKKAIESIFTTFILVIVLVVVAIMFTYVGYSSVAVKNIISGNADKFNTAANAKDVIIDCLNQNGNNPEEIESCFPTGFISGYIKGFLIEEVYGDGCDSEYRFGGESDDIIIYWVNTYNETACLSKLKLMI